MVSKKEIYFEKAIPFHTVSRAVEGKEIFLHQNDAYRFIFQMYAANIGSPGYGLHRKDINKVAQAILNGENISQRFVVVKHPSLVTHLSFALTVNHHHFVLVQNIKGGLSKYLQKLHGGFAKYFNLKRGRKDILFERQTKIIPIKTNFQVDAVIRYVNIKNPLDVYQPGWKEKGLKNRDAALEFLDRYPFSSFPDLFGKRNSKILGSKEIIEKYLGKDTQKNRTAYLHFVDDYLQGNLLLYSPLFLEEQ